MIKLNVFRQAILAITLIAYGSLASAGSEADLRNEISFLAKKLLDKSGKDEITIDQPSIMKPFLGICGEPGGKGVLLTCVTPGHNAYKFGLKTGDLITSINGVSMLDQNAHSKGLDSPYFSLLNKMKTGDVLKFVLLRRAKEVELDVTVGALNQPSYTMIIKRN